MTKLEEVSFPEECWDHRTGEHKKTGKKLVYLDDAAAIIEQAESALKVIYIWAGTPGALHPQHVRELCAKALGIDNH